jgi:hypothetical protein
MNHLRQWGVNPQQAKTTHTREDKGFLDEYYWDKKHQVLFRWWRGRGWIRTSVPVSEVSRVIEPTPQPECTFLDELCPDHADNKD